MEPIKVSEVALNEWKNYALAVITERAIPSVVDGLKPVQRYLFYLGFRDKDMKKVAAYAGNLAEAGYEHGEGSGADALTKLTAAAQNILPLWEGKGNFGNKLDKACAQPRYIFSKLAPIIPYLFKDNDLCPENPDPEQLPPLYYLPIIPLCLLNGVKGIAVGWSCDIPSHTPESIIDALISLTEGKEPKPIIPAYPKFTGSVENMGDYYQISGKWKLESQTKLRITEIPPSYDQESYQAVLDKLVEKNFIVDYEDNSKKDYYDILVTLKRSKEYTEEIIWDKFKLRTTHKWNVTTISEEMRLQEWNQKTAFLDIIKYFYKIRVPYIKTRIENKIKKLELELLYREAYIRFALDVVARKFDWKISEPQFENILLDKYKMPEEYVPKTMNSAVRSFTSENIDKARKIIEELKKELDYYKKTTPEKEYKKDLLELKKNVQDR